MRALPKRYRRTKSLSELIVDEVTGVFDDEKNPPELFYVAGGVFASVGVGFPYRCIVD
jgi:hypothetical protein